MDLMGDAITQISLETGGPVAEESVLPNLRLEESEINGVTPNNSDWFPFLNKEVSQKMQQI
jgi:hypothetical protein